MNRMPAPTLPVIVSDSVSSLGDLSLPYSIALCFLPSYIVDRHTSYTDRQTNKQTNIGIEREKASKWQTSIQTEAESSRKAKSEGRSSKIIISEKKNRHPRAKTVVSGQPTQIIKTGTRPQNLNWPHHHYGSIEKEAEKAKERHTSQTLNNYRIQLFQKWLFDFFYLSHLDLRPLSPFLLPHLFFLFFIFWLLRPPTRVLVREEEGPHCSDAVTVRWNKLKYCDTLEWQNLNWLALALFSLLNLQTPWNIFCVLSLLATYWNWECICIDATHANFTKKDTHWAEAIGNEVQPLMRKEWERLSIL